MWYLKQCIDIEDRNNNIILLYYFCFGANINRTSFVYHRIILLDREFLNEYGCESYFDFRISITGLWITILLLIYIENEMNI